MKTKYVWTVVLLVGSYVLCQAVADVAATKIVQLGNIVLPAGSIIFAATFTIRDLVHKRLGKEWARACIVSAALFNVVMALYLAWMAAMPSPPWFELHDAWSAIFAIVPSIVIASITAEVVSEWIDTEVYHVYKEKFSNAPQWTRVLVSNAISLPIDSFIFATLAFVVLPHLLGGEPMPFLGAILMTIGQIVWKAAVTIVSMPLIYLVKDEPINFSIA